MRQMIVLLASLILLSGLSLVYFEQHSRKLIVEWQALRRHEAAIQLEWRQLRLEESTLTAEAKLDQVARQQLKLFIPSPEVVVYVMPVSASMSP